MKMKRIVIILLSMMALLQSGAQKIVKSTGQKITESAILGSCVVVKQSYQIKNKKTGIVYGRNGRDEFGKSYSIGVKTDAGLVLIEKAIKPWLYDVDFKKVKDDYDPLIFLTEVGEIVSDAKVSYSACPISIGHQQPNGAWVANVSVNSPNILGIDTELGQKDGWLVWYTADNINSNDSTALSVQSVNRKIEANEEGVDIDVEAPIGAGTPVGGIYVCPFYEGNGRVVYKLTGIIIQNDNKWVLRTPFVGYFYEKSSSENTESPQVKSKDGAVQDTDSLDLTPIQDDSEKSGSPQKRSRKTKK